MRPLPFTFILILALAISAFAQDFLTDRKIAKIAILPVVGESVPSNVRDTAADQLMAAINKQNLKVEISTPADSVGILDKASRLEDFTSFLNLFTKTGTINKAALERCGESLKGHLLLIEVQEYTERGGSWLRGRSGQNTARIQYTLFTQDGEQIWQTLESLHRSQLTTTVAPMPEIIGRVSERAVENLIKGKENRDVKQKRGGRAIY